MEQSVEHQRLRERKLHVNVANVAQISVQKLKDHEIDFTYSQNRNLRKPIGDISLDGLGQDWTLRRYILHLNDI